VAELSPSLCVTVAAKVTPQGVEVAWTDMGIYYVYSRSFRFCDRKLAARSQRFMAC